MSVMRGLEVREMWGERRTERGVMSIERGGRENEKEQLMREGEGVSEEEGECGRRKSMSNPHISC